MPLFYQFTNTGKKTKHLATVVQVSVQASPNIDIVNKGAATCTENNHQLHSPLFSSYSQLIHSETIISHLVMEDTKLA